MLTQPGRLSGGKARSWNLNISGAAADLLVFALVSGVIRWLYVFLFPWCFSYDVFSWNLVADTLMAGNNPYNATETLNWPPLWMQLLFLFKKISLASQVPFDLILRLFLIAVETVEAVLLYAVLVRFAPGVRPRRLLLAGLALNPISILQVCQHCNFDVLVGVWILLAVALLMRFHAEGDPAYWLGACLALGLGAATKTVPLLLAPLLLPGARNLKRFEQGLGVVLLLLPVTLSMSIIYVLGPHDIQTKVLDYRPKPGFFGFTGCFTLLGWPGLVKMWVWVFEVIFGLGWVILSVWLWAKPKLLAPELARCALVLLTAIPAFGPGFGMQYIGWYIPLAILLYGMSERGDRIFLLTGYGVTAVVYVITYGFNYTTFGGFALNLVQTKGLLDFGRHIDTLAGQAWVTLPLWLYFLAFFVYFSGRIGSQMRRDLHK